MANALTVFECLESRDELTSDQLSLLLFVVGGSSRGNTLHPHITDLRSLRRWLQAGVDENNDYDAADARADHHHAMLDQ